MTGCLPYGNVSRFAARFPRSVGRGLGPAVGVCFVFTFLGNVAAPAPCVIRFGFFTRHSRFLYLRSAPIHGPGSGAAIAEPTLCVGFACGKKPKKPPLVPRRKGPAGPFGNPGASRGSPETVYVPHKAKALCYNTVSFLPERLIRAPVLKPRPRSRAGRSVENTCLAHLPTVSGRFVGAACMRPVAVCPVVTFFGSCTRYPYL